METDLAPPLVFLVGEGVAVAAAACLADARLGVLGVEGAILNVAKLALLTVGSRGKGGKMRRRRGASSVDDPTSTPNRAMASGGMMMTGFPRSTLAFFVRSCQQAEEDCI